MSDIDKDIKRLELTINEIIDETKNYTVSELVNKDIKVSTICRFRQRRDDIFSINSRTLINIAKRLDSLSSSKSCIEKSVIQELTIFIDKYILKAIRIENNAIKINHATLKKYRVASKQYKFNLRTLINHAKEFENTHAESKKG